MVFWKSSSNKCRRKKSCEYSKEQRKEFRGKATCSLGFRAVCVPLPGAGRLDTAGKWSAAGKPAGSVQASGSDLLVVVNPDGLHHRLGV